MVRKRQSRPGSLALVGLCLGWLGSPVYAQSPPVTLAWDASPDPFVAGYIVYVGSTSGSYTEQYDVGNHTSFVYADVVAGQPYYVAVAAYTPRRVIGPRSEEVFFMGSAVVGNEPSRPPPIAKASQASLPSPEDRHVSCVRDMTCYVVDRLANGLGEVRALTPTGDGRLFFIENGTHVRVVVGDTLLPRAALSAGPGVRLTGIALDRSFDQSGMVYVGEVETRPDGSRSLKILRYREVAHLLAEGATIVPGLPLPHEGDAPFAIDAAGRLYVAMPAPLDGTRASPYTGMVLRFESDGSVPRESRAGSPIFSYGDGQPVSLVWSSARNELWLAGSNANGTRPLARLSLDGNVTEWPQVPRPAALDAALPIRSLFSAERPTRAFAPDDATGNLIAVDENGTLLRIDVRAARSMPVSPRHGAEIGGAPLAAVIDGDHIYVVVMTSGIPARSSAQIVRLRRLD